MISYKSDMKENQNWVLTETEFDSRFLGKCEAIMCLGNGYMGMRSAAEEKYLGEKRNLFVAGTFNKFDENEVTELPNCADITAVELEINGVIFNLNIGTVSNYSRALNFKNGELIRRFTWETKETGRIEFEFKRFISFDNLHLVIQKLTIKPLDMDIAIKLASGIDGQMTNSGVQHFSEGAKRLYEGKCMQFVQTTTQSSIDIVHNLVHKISKNENEFNYKALIAMDRRKIYFDYEFKIEKSSTLAVEKFASIHTSRDKELLNSEYKLAELQESTWRELIANSTKGYEGLLSESEKAWYDKVWSKSDIIIESENEEDQLAMRFAQYHLNVMTPVHDNRMNIGAKGLSGEGYKGHTFWDTEIFMLPYFIWSHPKNARSLLEYRYLCLDGARRKALENGYEGAMYPWESAWVDDGETTPVWGAADIVTGEPMKILSGFIEQHITSDIVFAVWQYYMVTNDNEFMDSCGYEITFECAKFWASRLEWDEDKGQYCINDIMGPDEYKEHINNNAFTNYTAHWTLGKAIEYYEYLKQHKPLKLSQLNDKLKLDEVFEIWKARKELIYLPQPNEQNVLPQDDAYLSKKNIDLSKYKNQEHVGEIFKDYNLKQVNEIQVTKQADALLLLYLFEYLFDYKVKKASWEYYEPRTLHDSSLSLSTHSVLANDMSNYELAYSLFRRATEIDMGTNMKTSDHGIHAASLGGIWQCVVYGFGGVRMLDGRLRINPCIPKCWKKLSFNIYWHKDKLTIDVTPAMITIKKNTNINTEIEIEVFGRNYILNSELTIPLNN